MTQITVDQMRTKSVTDQELARLVTKFSNLIKPIRRPTMTLDKILACNGKMRKRMNTYQRRIASDKPEHQTWCMTKMVEEFRIFYSGVIVSFILNSTAIQEFCMRDDMQHIWQLHIDEMLQDRAASLPNQNSVEKPQSFGEYEASQRPFGKFVAEVLLCAYDEYVEIGRENPLALTPTFLAEGKKLLDAAKSFGASGAKRELEQIQLESEDVVAAPACACGI